MQMCPTISVVKNKSRVTVYVAVPVILDGAPSITDVLIVNGRFSSVGLSISPCPSSSVTYTHKYLMTRCWTELSLKTFAIGLPAITPRYVIHLDDLESGSQWPTLLMPSFLQLKFKFRRNCFSHFPKNFVRPILARE